MRAVIYEEYGDAEVLRQATLPRPSPSAGEIVVQVRAVEVTKSDTELRSLRFPVKWFAWLLRLFLGLRRPKRQVLGSYFSGVVTELGPGTSRFSKGDEVFGSSQLRMGAYGEYLVVPEAYTIAHKPRTASFEEAAAVPLGGLNALHFLRLARVQRGQQILINGGGGSIGSFAIQIARAMGARVTVVDAPQRRHSSVP